MSAEPARPSNPPVVDRDGYLTWDRLSEPKGVFRRVLSRATAHSALLSTGRGVLAGARRSGTAAYGEAYERLLRHGLTPAEWKHIEAFYQELLALSAQHDFQLVVIVMPVIDIVGRPDTATHAYPTQAKALLAAHAIPFVDTFDLWNAKGLGRELFLPQGPDAHLNAGGYDVIAARTVEMFLSKDVLKTRLAGAR